VGSAQKSPRHGTQSTSQTTPDTMQKLSMEELALLKRQEAQGKISLVHSFPDAAQIDHDIVGSDTFTFGVADSHPNTTHGFVFTHVPLDNTTPPKPIFPQPNIAQPAHTLQPDIHKTHTHRDNQNNFSLSIARLKIDFPVFADEEPFNWLRQCEKYFTLAQVPMETWVPLATLHCSGIA
jgi:hypothetical protein